jgi:hypothetical protein
VNPLQLSPLFVAAAFSACAVGKPDAPVSGTWIAHTRVTTCPQCETWFNLDLYENSQGIVTGVVGNETHGEIDGTISAAYVVGNRVGDSITLVVTVPCDSSARRGIQGLRGLVSPRGDTLSGEFWSRLSTPTLRIPLIFHRGAIDSVILKEIEKLTATCDAAA